MSKIYRKIRGRRSSKSVVDEFNLSSPSGIDVRCTLVGDSRVGKTSLLLSYQLENFQTQHCQTKFDSYSKKVKYEQSDVNLLLYDNGGNERLSQYGPKGNIQTDIFFFCFAVDDHDSFENISKKWKNELQNCYPEDENDGCITSGRNSSRLSQPLIMLVGCKADKRVALPVFKQIRTLRKDSVSELRRGMDKQPSLGGHPISVQEAERKKTEIGAFRYMECSAKEGKGIKEIFHEAIKAVLNRRNYAKFNK